jgi:DNA invertase Pin-like site-specific DNA recombinase
VNAGTPVIGYVRISRESETQAGLDAQRDAIERECAHRGWELVDVVEEIASAATVRKRPRFRAAIRRVEAGEAEAILVAKLDRVSRSVIDFATLVEQAKRRGWRLVILDLGIDLGTAHGEMIATVLAALAQWERRMISQRTKEGLAARRAAGVVLGRRPRIDPLVRARILRLRGRGWSYARIARQLNEQAVPTADGAPVWSRQVVRRVCLQRQKSAASH